MFYGLLFLAEIAALGYGVEALLPLIEDWAIRRWVIGHIIADEIMAEYRKIGLLS